MKILLGIILGFFLGIFGLYGFFVYQMWFADELEAARLYREAQKFRLLPKVRFDTWEQAVDYLSELPNE